MAVIHVTLADGQKRDIEAVAGTLMEALRDADVGIEGVCGGMLSCGTCHVYVADTSKEKLAAGPGEDEADMLEAMADVMPVTPHSRLSCQIGVSDTLDGLEIVIPILD